MTIVKTFFSRRPKKTSEVDDDFFNLEKFNKWTEQQEELDMMSDREDDGFDFDEDLEDLEDTDDEYQDAAGEWLISFIYIRF